METQTGPVLISCPLHTSEFIQKVDSRPEATKHLFCSDCILENENPKSLSGNLVPVDQFLTNASVFYFTNKQKISPVSESPGEYASILSSQAEELEKLTQHLDKEKKSIEYVFEEVSKIVLDLIKQKKSFYFKLLDDQFLNVYNRYQLFEKELKKRYNSKPEEIEFLFPSKQELQNRFAKVKTASSFASFIQGIKDDINQAMSESDDIRDINAKKKHFDAYAKDLQEAISKKPFFETKALDLNNVVAPIKEALDKFLQRSLVLKEEISPNQFLNRALIDTKIITAGHFHLIKRWLPEKYEFSPKLLYRSSRDGFTPQTFHSKCDAKGPTITFIRCQFAGSNKTSIIGGFLSESWNQNTSWIQAPDSFIFSLTKNVKYKVVQGQNAGYGVAGQGPCFGGGFNIAIMADVNGCYCNPNGSFEQNGVGIIEAENYGGSGQAKFVPDEIEVFSIN